MTRNVTAEQRNKISQAVTSLNSCVQILFPDLPDEERQKVVTATSELTAAANAFVQDASPNNLRLLDGTEKKFSQALSLVQPALLAAFLSKLNDLNGHQMEEDRHAYTAPLDMIRIRLADIRTIVTFFRSANPDSPTL